MLWPGYVLAAALLLLCAAAAGWFLFADRAQAAATAAGVISALR